MIFFYTQSLIILKDVAFQIKKITKLFGHLTIVLILLYAILRSNNTILYLEYNTDVEF